MNILTLLERTFYKTMISIIVILHYLIVLFIVELPGVLFGLGYYVSSILAGAFMFRKVLMHVYCPFNSLQRPFERRLGLPETTRFIRQWGFEAAKSWGRLWSI